MRRFRFAFHNIVIHPICGGLWLIGATRLADRLHGNEPMPETANSPEAPVPAQDDDKLRTAIGHMSWMRKFVPCVFDVTEDRLNEIDDFISQEEDALKSTAAQEGGSK